MSESLDPRVQRFLSAYVESAEELELLLLLHREPARGWTAAEVSQAVYTVPASATLRLERLAGGGLVASSGGGDPQYRYAPRSAALAADVDALAAAYRANRVAVIKHVFGRKPDPVRSFADAFRVRNRGGE